MPLSNVFVQLFPLPPPPSVLDWINMTALTTSLLVWQVNHIPPPPVLLKAPEETNSTNDKAILILIRSSSAVFFQPLLSRLIHCYSKNGDVCNKIILQSSIIWHSYQWGRLVRLLQKIFPIPPPSVSATNKTSIFCSFSPFLGGLSNKWRFFQQVLVIDF